MTLAQFKKRSKTLGIFAFLIIYGAGFYQLGKSSSLVNFIKVKGVSTKQTSSFSTPIESPAPYADTQSAKILSSFVKLCANTVYGFEISYPKDWFTTYNTEDQKCNFYAPYSFVVPQDLTNFTSPIRIEVVNPEEWQTTSKFHENPNDFYNVTGQEDLEVGGRIVKKIEATATGKGQAARGYARTTYLIFDPLKPMIVSYSQTVEAENVKVNKKIIEDVVSTVNFF
ncbi:MAG: hypothetical protein NUV69_01800 [Candidatus Curtissbacteria bacterium]|nr:hypothetical protein [Candidatus Curtissbacteria bacterium]